MYTSNYKMAVARDDLGEVARKRGIEGQVTTIRHFGIRCICGNFWFNGAFTERVQFTTRDGDASFLNTPVNAA